MSQSSKSQIIIYQTPDGLSDVALYAKNGNVWMNQKQLATLFDTSIPNISLHIKNLFIDQELPQYSVVKDYLTTALDGKKYTV